MDRNMRSNDVTKGYERAASRALMYATGIDPSQIGKPMIGIASSFSDLVPGHIGMRDLERFIEKGIHSGGFSVKSIMMKNQESMRNHR